ncbi:NAD(P)-binding protein [Teratosphaeria nubilosa]|uniref:NAD(P)-binding protein n=1 Tax=Teratosphaeria nubilosa TaxID=161662 RepID=A0A6G1L452_9PEZI|nr:NAD(P)-binding protein [Teratosphaeria nubilosa]
MTNPKTIIVTGANRGIGLAICRLLLANPATKPLRLVATSRQGEDLNLQPAARDGDEVLYRRLDVADRRSVEAFTEGWRRGVDVLVNNAGVNLDLGGGYGVESARRTFEVNYWGVVEMCRRILPLLNPHGSRIVNLSSVASSLNNYSPAIQARIRDPNATFTDLDSIAKDFLSSVQTSTEEASGFGPPPRSYNVSKSLVNAATALLARENPGVLVNCCCPGWIDTDMGGLAGSQKQRPPKSAEEGARIPVRLAVGEVGGVSGAYWANESVRGKGEGSVREW